MSGRSILSVIVILVSLGMIIFRIFKEIGLRQVSKKGPTDKIFKRKLAFVKQKQYYSHTLALLFLSLFLLIGLSLTVVQLFQIENQYNRLQKEQTKITADFKQLQQDKIDLAFNLPVSPYPETGIGLKDYDWKSIVEGEDKQKQLEIELAVAQNLMPYFGVTTAIVIFNAPTQTLHVNFIFELSSNQKQDEAVENISALIQEIEGIEYITQVNIQLKNLENKKIEQNEYYIRTNTEDPFRHLESPSEVEAEQVVESTTKVEQ